ncbi:hypothetical protein HMPREF3214_01471 [Alloscardovia omnicolens]|nr:hypothetical protein HMPREF3214_01471 [Alloscardovia omnicolens]
MFLPFFLLKEIVCGADQSALSASSLLAAQYKREVWVRYEPGKRVGISEWHGDGAVDVFSVKDIAYVALDMRCLR